MATKKSDGVIWCKRCLYPNTKPDLHFNEKGVCDACRNFENRAEVDWETRRQEFLAIMDRYRSKDQSNYDCIVPVSGGKDSHYQTIKLLELGLNPLCVTAVTDSLTEIGRRNLENLKCLGVDCIEVTCNPVVRRKINRLSLRQIGDISWPEHVSIFTVPVRAAVQYGIPLIVWGENSQNEYGGPAANSEHQFLGRRWLEEFGGLLGLRVSDLVGVEGIERRDLIPYTYPTDDELKRVGVVGVWLGRYVPWDGFGNALYAQTYGFETVGHTIEGSLCNYENIDNYQAGIHDYFKYLKFGFGRATDLACNHIRRGRLMRDDALRLVELTDGKFPWTYLDRPIGDILAEIEVTLDEFLKICDRYTNKKLFRCDNQGKPVKDKNGNLLKVA